MGSKPNHTFSPWRLRSHLHCIGHCTTHVPGLRCTGSAALPMLPTLLSVLMVIFEGAVALLTGIRAIQAARSQVSREELRKSGLLYLILEQGVLYISFMTALGFAAIILNYRAPSGFLQRLLNAITLPISCLLTARFLLHIRQWDSRPSHAMHGGNGLNTGQASTHASNLSVFFAVPGPDVVGANGGINSLVDEFGSDPVFWMPSGEDITRLEDVVPEVDESDGITPSTRVAGDNRETVIDNAEYNA
ncbi:hypothetical protein BXZ70DRAFT_730318 [Cristinia sonorae]|uniref:Transmembrane protein n=1 Tax=Cristinia sonorae TaxID=1940300 RepID=A0A8K0UUA4_9AGAR|nr:hypothetical protein BXZ70DRAFT_730318 [Cristinia sonorae]